MEPSKRAREHSFITDASDKQPELVEEPGIRWLCMRDLDVSENGMFAMRCATEMGFLSATRSRDVAVDKARKFNPPAALLRLDVGDPTDPVALGAHIAPFSINPQEYEVVYPPGSFLQYLYVTAVQELVPEPAASDKQSAAGSQAEKKEIKLHIVDVSPQFA